MIMLTKIAKDRVREFATRAGVGLAAVKMWGSRWQADEYRHFTVDLETCRNSLTLHSQVALWRVGFVYVVEGAMVSAQWYRRSGQVVLMYRRWAPLAGSRPE